MADDDGSANMKKSRARVFKACARCRAGKMRCDGQPTCRNCFERNTECVYPAERKHRGPGKSKQRLEALEARLASMESNLRQGNSGDDSMSPDQLPPSSLALIRLDADVLELPTKCDFLQNLYPALSGAPFITNLNQLIRPQSVTAKIIAASAISWNNHSPGSPPGALAQSWSLFRQVFASLPDLLMRGDSLDSAQALTMMVMHMRQSADTQTTALLLSLASRMQCLSDTRFWPPTSSSSSTQQQQAANETDTQTFSQLFWTTFILDMEMSSHTGLPPSYTAQPSSTIFSTESYPFSDWTPARSQSLPDLPAATTRLEQIFRLRAALAQIQQRIGIKSAKPEARLLELSTAESDLEEWRREVPREIRPDWRGNSFSDSQYSHYQSTASSSVSGSGENGRDGEGENGEIDIPTATLQLAYYNTLAMLCWEWARTVAAKMLSAGIRVGIVTQEITGHGLMARYAAQETLRVFLKLGTGRGFVEIWGLLCYPLSAAITLLSCVCHHPKDRLVQDELSLLGSFVDFLARMISENGYDLARMRDGLAKLVAVASDAVSVATASSMPVNPSLWPLSLASGRTGRAIGTLVTCSSHQPMYLAQSLMGNMRNSDTHCAEELVGLLGIAWGKNGYGPFVPDSLMPCTYGFVPGSA